MYKDDSFVKGNAAAGVPLHYKPLTGPAKAGRKFMVITLDTKSHWDTAVKNVRVNSV